MDATFKTERRLWTTEETRAFLSAYIARKEEFKIGRKKKFAMQNVLLDLESQGVLSQPTTVDMLIAKFKNLVRAYKQGVDKNICTFADLMEEIYGVGSFISNSHSINERTDYETSVKKPRRLNETKRENDDIPPTSPETLSQLSTEEVYMSDCDSGNFLFEDVKAEHHAEDTSDLELTRNICKGLKGWAIRNNISHSSVTDLLNTLTDAGIKGLPKSASIILESSQQSEERILSAMTRVESKLDALTQFESRFEDFGMRLSSLEKRIDGKMPNNII